jgi:hypothetical protein
LLVDVGAGFCPGIQAVPGSALAVSGRTSNNNPRRIESTTSTVVDRYNISVTVVVDALQDGETMNVYVTMLTPFPCLNPEISAQLKRVE